MKHTHKFLPLLFAAALMCGCKDSSYIEDVNAMELSNNKLEFQANGGQAHISVANVSDWQAESGADWLTATRQGTSLTVTCSTYEQPSPRRASVTVRSGSVTRAVSVTQYGTNPELTLSIYQYDAPCEQGECAFNVISNAEWTATVIGQCDWLKFIREDGSDTTGASGTIGTTALKLRFLANTSGVSRSGEAIFRIGDKDMCSVTIKQGVPYMINIDKESIEFTAAGGQQTAKLTCSSNWEFYDIPEWLTVSPSSGSSTAEDEDIVFSVPASTKFEDRSASVKVRCKEDPNITDRIAVSQKGSSEVTLDLLFFDTSAHPAVVDPKIVNSGGTNQGIVTEKLSVDPSWVFKFYSSGYFKISSGNGFVMKSGSASDAAKYANNVKDHNGAYQARNVIMLPNHSSDGVAPVKVVVTLKKDNEATGRSMYVSTADFYSTNDEAKAAAVTNVIDKATVGGDNTLTFSSPALNKDYYLYMPSNKTTGADGKTYYEYHIIDIKITYRKLQ